MYFDQTFTSQVIYPTETLSVQKYIYMYVYYSTTRKGQKKLDHTSTFMSRGMAK